MEVVNVSDVSMSLFITGSVFILLIGSFLSLGVLRMFQMRKRQGSLFLGLAAVSLVGMIISLNTWFA